MRQYDLVSRCEDFAVELRTFFKKIQIPYPYANDLKQLIRASGSIGANYIEANDSLGFKDFIFRLRIARKEAKESAYWLRIIKRSQVDEPKVDRLIDEAEQLTKILSSIINNISSQTPK